MKIYVIVISLLLFVGCSTQRASVSTTNSTVAAGGYDVVSYHQNAKPQRGNGNHVANYNGATYLFVDNTNKEEFEQNPEKYAPAYGGYCAFGVSVGKKFVGDPDVWKVVNGKLYLNLDTSIQDEWHKDIPENITKANKNWPSIKHLAPGDL